MPEKYSNFDISGPCVDDDVRRLIGRYSAEKVKEAIKRQAAGKRGPIPKRDWPEMLHILREDARSWLNGGDPFKARSNLSIARDFAAKHPGYSSDATHDRIVRKLRERRRYYTLVDAEWLSRSEFPYVENLRAIAALREIGIMRQYWDGLSVAHEGSLADYRRKFGEPLAAVTMHELLIEAAKPITATPDSRSTNVLQFLVGNRPA